MEGTVRLKPYAIDGQARIHPLQRRDDWMCSGKAVTQRLINQSQHTFLTDY
jgi:hypothetical protein